MLATLLGCTGYTEQPIYTPEPEQEPEPVLTENDNTVSELPDTAYATTSDGVTYEKPTQTSSDSGLWLLGQSAYMKDLYPGMAPRTMKFTIGNGINDNVTREIYIRIEQEDDRDLKGYEQLPEEYFDWFVIDADYFVLQPGGQKTIHVSIGMPEGIDYSGKKARCELLILGYTVIGTTINAEGKTVNLVDNVPIGVASEFYIETY